MGIKLLAEQCLIASWLSPRDWSYAIAGLVITGLIAVMVFLLLMKIGVLGQAIQLTNLSQHLIG